MTLEIALLFGIILALLILFVLEIFPTDTVAIGLMVVLMLGGFVSPSEGIAGLSNEATVTVLALMILSVGLESTGVINQIGQRLRKVFDEREGRTILIIMLIVGLCSAFIATTAVVIVFMRIMVKLTQKMPTRLAKILMPLSFAGILGGSCTLLGTSTNLLVSSIAAKYSMPAFGIFEFSHIGIVFFIAGLLYMLFIGRFLIPKHQRETELTDRYEIEDYITEVTVEAESNLIGKPLEEANCFAGEDIDLLQLKSKRNRYRFPNRAIHLQEGDVLLVKGSMEKIADLRSDHDLTIITEKKAYKDEQLHNEDVILCEVIIRPGSRLIGKTLDKLVLKRDYNAIPLAVKHKRKNFATRLRQIKIEAGDTLLMQVERSTFQRFYNLPDFVVLQEYPELAVKTGKRYLSAGIVAMVIVLAALNVLPILVSALLGCVLMFLTRCLDLQKAYREVDWSVFFLLAGVIPLGTAMDNTGASELIAMKFVEWFGKVSPRMLVSILFIFTALLSSIISNNATAILLTPIAISIATSLQLDPRPLLFTVMFAANTSYISPIGYQTNTLIYGPGGYKFSDYVKVGGGLTLLIWLLASFLIPYLYF